MYELPCVKLARQFRHVEPAVVLAPWPLPLDQAIDAVLQAARGLEYAHKQGVVHRDIKPSNLLIDKQGTVKILDLGLARLAEPAAADDVQTEAGLTRAGQLMGTVDFMPPEQAADARHADHRADIYSLGATLYFLLTARPMYEGNTLVDRLIAHRQKPIPSLRQACPQVPPALDLLYRSMVAKSPEDRPQSMSDVIATLEKLRPAAGRSAQPRPVSPVVASAETLPPEPASVTTSPGVHPGLSRIVREQPPPGSGKVVQRNQKMRQAWDRTIRAADRQYKRRHGLGLIGFLSRLAEKTLNLVIGLIIVVFALGSVYAGWSVWRTQSLLADSRQAVQDALNPALRQRQLQDLSSVEFDNVTWLSWFVGLPQQLEFVTEVYELSASGGNAVGTLRGQFDRTKGRVEMTIDYRSGVRQPRVELAAKKVP